MLPYFNTPTKTNVKLDDTIQSRGLTNYVGDRSCDRPNSWRMRSKFSPKRPERRSMNSTNTGDPRVNPHRSTISNHHTYNGNYIKTTRYLKFPSISTHPYRNILTNPHTSQTEISLAQNATTFSCGRMCHSILSSYGNTATLLGHDPFSRTPNNITV